MIRAAIVEDDARDRASIRECLSYVEKAEGLQFDVSEFSTGPSFLEHYTPDYDIVFMDIEMPGINGMETARELRSMDASVILIFITNLAQYAISGYEVEALDFILKPINKLNFAIKVKRAAARMNRRINESITVKTRGEIRSIRISSIRYVEVNGHYVIYHTLEGDLTEYVTLKEVQSRIDQTVFVLSSRSYLVNLQYVDAVERDTAVVGGDRLQISRPQRKAFLSALSEYMGGRR